MMSIHSLIWLFLAAFMLHDFEEIIRIEPWFRKNAEELSGKIPAGFRSTFLTMSRMTSSQFAMAVCVEFIGFIPVTFLAAEKGIYLPFLGINAILLLHVFVHIAQAVCVRKLVPGVVTAVAITLPYSVYLFSVLLKESVIGLSDIWLSLPIGLLLIPLVWIGHLAGESLVSR